MIAPEVPVIVIVTEDPAGVVCAPEELPHPTAHSENRETTSSKPNTFLATPPLPVNGFRLRVVKKVPKSPSPGSKPTKAAMW